MKCGQCGYAEARTPLQLRQHVRKRHQPKSESSAGVMLQLETGENVPASEGGVRWGKSRSKVQVGGAYRVTDVVAAGPWLG